MLSRLQLGRPMISESSDSARAPPANRVTKIAATGLIRTATPTSGGLAVAAGRALARQMDLGVCLVAQHVVAGLHRRVREVLAAILRNDPTGAECEHQRETQRDDQRTKAHSAESN